MLVRGSKNASRERTGTHTSPCVTLAIGSCSLYVHIALRFDASRFCVRLSAITCVRSACSYLSSCRDGYSRAILRDGFEMRSHQTSLSISLSLVSTPSSCFFASSCNSALYRILFCPSGFDDHLLLYRFFPLQCKIIFHKLFSQDIRGSIDTCSSLSQYYILS